MCACVFQKIKQIEAQRVGVPSTNLDRVVRLPCSGHTGVEGRMTQLPPWREEHPGIGTTGMNTLGWDLDLCVRRQKGGPWGWSTVKKGKNKVRLQRSQGQGAHLGSGDQDPDLILGKM